MYRFPTLMLAMMLCASSFGQINTYLFSKKPVEELVLNKQKDSDATGSEEETGEVLPNDPRALRAHLRVAKALEKSLDKLIEAWGDSLDVAETMERKKECLDSINVNSKRLIDQSALRRTIQYQSKYVGFQQGTPSLLPVLDTVTARAFSNYAYGKSSGLNVLNGYALQASEGNVSVFSEIASDYVGPLRLSLGSTITASADTLLGDEAVQRFLTGGGNAVLKTDFPVFFQSNGSYALSLNSSLKLATDLPNVGVPTSEFGLNMDYGFELMGALRTVNGVFGAFGVIRAARVRGNELFFNQLGVCQESFGYVQLNGGLTVFGNFRIGVSWPMYASNGIFDDRKPLLSLQIIPN